MSRRGTRGTCIRGSLAASHPQSGNSRLGPAWRGFTLIELLVVIAIIALLVALLLPSLWRANFLAKEAVCASHLSSVGRAVAMYLADRERDQPWIFSNGSGDHPHEGHKERNLPGNPANVLVPDFVLPQMLFSPLAPVTYEEHYQQNPTSGKYWGTYCWRFYKITRFEDPDYPGLHGNDIRYVNPYTDSVVMTDTDGGFWSKLGYEEGWFHYHALMLDSSVQFITRDAMESRRWLWGPKGKPYDSYRD